jgi:cytochrome c-type biogenesis protein CcmE
MKYKFSILLVSIAIISTVLIIKATSSSSAQVYLPSELLKETNSNSLKRVRIGGRVTDQPIDYQVTPNIELKFNIADPGQGSPNVPVVYSGLKPDMFASGRDVIIDGEYSDGVIKAATLLTQCPSKYEPPNPASNYQDTQTTR